MTRRRTLAEASLYDLLGVIVDLLFEEPMNGDGHIARVASAKWAAQAAREELDFAWPTASDQAQALQRIGPIARKGVSIQVDPRIEQLRGGVNLPTNPLDAR